MWKSQEEIKAKVLGGNRSWCGPGFFCTKSEEEIKKDHQDAPGNAQQQGQADSLDAHSLT